MKIILAALIISALAVPALAQQQPDDTEFMKRALAAMQSQRNQALDAAAISAARAGGLSDDLAKANARIKELEPKPDTKKK